MVGRVRCSHMAAGISHPRPAKFGTPHLQCEADISLWGPIDRMTLQDFASIGELLGAVGVIISLIYLAAQVQQNTAALRASSITAVTDKTAEGMGMVATSPELARLLGKGVAGESPLEPDEKIRFELLMGNWFTHWQGMHRQISVGAIDEELFSAWLPVIAYYAKNPLVSDWLASSRSALTPQFRSFLSELVPPGAPPREGSGR